MHKRVVASMTDVGRDGSDIAANIAAVRARIVAACERAGRSADGVTLIGISKTHPAAAVAEAYAAGLRDFGENRVQEAAAEDR